MQVMGTLGTRAAAIFDLDDDGDLDIVTHEFGAAPQVLISDLAQRHEVNWLSVKLVGRQSNRDGLGALVRVSSGDVTWTKLHDGKSGYLSQSSMPLYFGLGEHEEVDRIEVQWPSGRRQTVSSGLETGRLIVIEER